MDLEYITGIVYSAETLTGIDGDQSFSGSDIRGYFNYDARLNALVGLRLRLLPPETPQYDYIVDGSGGIPARADWIHDIQTEYFWSDVPVDAKVQVSNDNSTWKNMYFAQYDTASPNGKFYYVFSGGRTSFSTIGGNELTEATCLSAGLLNSKYFIIYSTTAKYYVWFNVDGTGINPSSQGGPFFATTYIGIEVKLYAADTADIVATKLKVVMDGLTDFRAILSPSGNTIVAIAVRTASKVYDPNSGTSGMTLVVKVQGGDKESYTYAKLVL